MELLNKNIERVLRFITQCIAFRNNLPRQNRQTQTVRGGFKLRQRFLYGKTQAFGLFQYQTTLFFKPLPLLFDTLAVNTQSATRHRLSARFRDDFAALFTLLGGWRGGFLFLLAQQPEFAHFLL